MNERVELSEPATIGADARRSAVSSSPSIVTVTTSGTVSPGCAG